MDGVDYFPLESGLSMEYRAKTSAGKGSMTIEIMSVTTNRGIEKALCRRTMRFGDENRQEYPVVIKDGSGVSAGSDVEFPLPATLGRKWRRDPAEFEISDLNGETTVPAGTFKGCLKVSCHLAGGRGGLGERFYAPGVGMVHEVCTDALNPYEYALIRVRRPRP